MSWRHVRRQLWRHWAFDEQFRPKKVRVFQLLYTSMRWHLPCGTSAQMRCHWICWLQYRWKSFDLSPHLARSSLYSDKNLMALNIKTTGIMFCEVTSPLRTSNPSCYSYWWPIAVVWLQQCPQRFSFIFNLALFGIFLVLLLYCI